MFQKNYFLRKKNAAQKNDVKKNKFLKNDQNNKEKQYKTGPTLLILKPFTLHSFSYDTSRLTNNNL